MVSHRAPIAVALVGAVVMTVTTAGAVRAEAPTTSSPPPIASPATPAGPTTSSPPTSAPPTTASPAAEPDDPEPAPATTAPQDPAPAGTAETPAVASPASPPATGPGRTTAPAVRVETVPGSTLPPTDDTTRPSDARAVITEILLNPVAVYDARGEWIEVHNPGGAPLDLAGWTIGDDVYDRHTITALTIEPGGYAVLARHGDPARNGGVVADYEYGDAMLLYNPGDQVVLRDADGAVVDEVDYARDDFVRPAGRSLSLIDPTLDNALGASWCLATTAMPGGDLGSPGRRTQCSESPATIVITEIMNNPRLTSDFGGEWFELHNDGPDPVDLAGFAVKDDDGERFTIDAPTVVAPGGYAVLGITTDRGANGNVDVAYAYGDRMRLHNSFDELVLVDPDGVQVDAVRWDDGRTFPDPNGASMTLLAPGIDNSLGENWCESSRQWAGGDLGSPGAPGDCIPQHPLEVVITEIMFDPEQTASERRGEWFELANADVVPAVLDGYELRTASAAHTIGSLTILPGERAVLAADGDGSANGGIVADYVYGTGLPLYNTISTLELVDPAGQTLDVVRWSPAGGFPDEPGHSIELRAVDVPNELGANWCVATERYGAGDFGTPGDPADCVVRPKPVPLLISEVLRNPAAVSDRLGEWFEVHNPTADPVDLRNWSIGDRGSEFHVIETSVVVPADGFVVIGRERDPAVNGGLHVDYATGGGMMLINGEDEIVLRDQYGRLVDEVAWTASGLMPRPNGGSMARTSEAMHGFATNLDVSQWCVTATQYGAGDRGTPGAANDCVPAPNHAVMINEIHRDAVAVADAKGEWVELHNAGPDPIDISGWTLRDDDFDEFRFDPDVELVIEAGGYLVLGRNSEALNGGVPIDVQYGVEFIHHNTADEIVLLDGEYVPVDRVAWTATNGFPKIPGAAMALRDPSLDNAVGTNWCAAVTDQGNGDFGTPGAANTCELPPDPPTSLPTAMTHSVFATADPSCGGIGIAGSKVDLADAVRSNGSLKVAGKGTLAGPVSHAGELSLGRKISTPGGVSHEPGAQPAPYGWHLADFALGGAHAVRAGTLYHHHAGDWKIDAKSVAAGVHYVDGDVIISGSSVKLNEVTIVATGSITIDGSSTDLRAFAADLPVLFSGAQGCHADGIDLDVSKLDFEGALYAPGARVTVNASVIKSKNGGVLGGTVLLEASKVELEIEDGR